MRKTRETSSLLGFMLLLFALAMISTTPVLTSARAAAPGVEPEVRQQILDRAKADYLAGQNMDKVIALALGAATKGGIAIEEISGALVETLLDAGAEAKEVLGHVIPQALKVGLEEGRTVEKMAAPLAKSLAAAGIQAGEVISYVIPSAINIGKDKGVAPEKIAGPLAEALMDTGIQLGEKGAVMARQVSTAVFEAVAAVEPDQTARLKAVQEMTQGIRASASRNALDQTAVRAEVEGALTAEAGPGEFSQQVARVIDSAYQQPSPETYTPPAVSAPAPPPDTPAEINDSYDPTASAS